MAQKSFKMLRRNVEESSIVQSYGKKKTLTKVKKQKELEVNFFGAILGYGSKPVGTKIITVVEQNQDIYLLESPFPI